MDTLSSSQISQVLNINRETLNILIKEEKIPLKNGAANMGVLTEWLGKGPAVIMAGEDAYLGRIRGEFEAHFPEALAALREYDRKCMEAVAVRRLKNLYRRGGKDYYLIKVPVKRGPAAGPAEGFRFYVRYRDSGGRLLPSKWSTGTSVLKEAESFAERNRAILLARYYARRPPGPESSLPSRGADRLDSGAEAGAEKQVFPVYQPSQRGHPGNGHPPCAGGWAVSFSPNSWEPLPVPPAPRGPAPANIQAPASASGRPACFPERTAAWGSYRFFRR
jgi:hypothetical protein